MTVPSPAGGFDQRGAIGFAERVLELLDEGRYTATYKYAVLLALLDVCLEHTQSSGAPPESVTTRQLAEKIVEIYWSHTVPFASRASASVLRQTSTGQAEIGSRRTRRIAARCGSYQTRRSGSAAPTGASASHGVFISGFKTMRGFGYAAGNSSRLIESQSRRR